MNRIYTKIAFLAVSALVFIASACSSKGQSAEAISTILDKADEAIAVRDTLTAEQLYAQLASQQDAMLPSQLCRQAIGYAHLAELSFSQAHMASATQCYAAAVELNADSVAAFAAQLPYADSATLATIRELTNALDPNNFHLGYPSEEDALEQPTDSIE